MKETKLFDSVRLSDALGEVWGNQNLNEIIARAVREALEEALRPENFRKILQISIDKIRGRVY